MQLLLPGKRRRGFLGTRLAVVRLPIGPRRSRRGTVEPRLDRSARSHGHRLDRASRQRAPRRAVEADRSGGCARRGAGRSRIRRRRAPAGGGAWRGRRFRGRARIRTSPLPPFGERSLDPRLRFGGPRRDAAPVRHAARRDSRLAARRVDVATAAGGGAADAASRPAFRAPVARCTGRTFRTLVRRPAAARLLRALTSSRVPLLVRGEPEPGAACSPDMPTFGGTGGAFGGQCARLSRIESPGHRARRSCRRHHALTVCLEQVDRLAPALATNPG